MIVGHVMLGACIAAILALASQGAQESAPTDCARSGEALSALADRTALKQRLEHLAD